MKYGPNMEYLIKYFGFGGLVSEVLATPVILRLLVEKAFSENMQGPEVDTLRRVFNHFKSNKPCESEEAFDELWRIDK